MTQNTIYIQNTNKKVITPHYVQSGLLAKWLIQGNLPKNQILYIDTFTTKHVLKLL